MKKGSLYIVSGPSGSGKTTLCAALLEAAPDLRLSVSCTTRPPRPGEQDGREYHFLDEAAFERQREEAAFLESAYVHGHWYGTRADDVEKMLQQSEDVLLEIDWQGAAQVAAKMPEACRIFILPPSIEVLEARLRSRGQDNEAVIAKRIAAAMGELAHADEAAYRIVNDDFDRATADLHAAYRAHQLHLQHFPA